MRHRVSSLGVGVHASAATSSPCDHTTPEPWLPLKAVERPYVVAGMRRLLSTKEACAYLDCHYRTICRMIDEGRLKAYRLGRKLKFRQEDLDRALEPVNTDSNALGDFITQQTKQAAS